jgi:hypothetical protein
MYGDQTGTIELDQIRFQQNDMPEPPPKTIFKSKAADI